MTGFPPPEHHLCLQPSTAHLETDIYSQPERALIPRMGCAATNPTRCSCGAGSTSKPASSPPAAASAALPGPGGTQHWGKRKKKTVLFKAYFISTNLLLDQYLAWCNKMNEAWKTSPGCSNLGCNLTPLLFFQSCFRLLLTLTPSQPHFSSREPTWHRVLCKAICCHQAWCQTPNSPAQSWVSHSRARLQGILNLSFFCQLVQGKPKNTSHFPMGIGRMCYRKLWPLPNYSRRAQHASHQYDL